MKRSLPSVAAAILASGMLFGTSAQAEQTPEEVQVYYPAMHFVIDGSEYAPPEEQKGFIYEGSTYVPLRFISYALQKAVNWDGSTYTVKVDKPSDMDAVTIQDYNANTMVRNPSGPASTAAAELTPQSIAVYKEKIHYVFDGKEKQPAEELPGFIYMDTLYVPMRFFSEAVGKSIDWDPKTYTVSAKKDEPALPEKPPETPKAPDKPAAPPVLGGGGGGGGGAVTKPSYDSIVNSAKSELSALQNGCKADLEALADQYIRTKDSSLIEQGSKKVAECDGRFAAIINNLRSQLEANQYDTGVIDQFEAEYQQIKNEAKSELLLKLAQ